MVPGSTFRYGSHFWIVILKPRLSRRQPIEEAATPLPKEETTPPVTNIYFGAIRVVRAATRSGLFLPLRCGGFAHRRIDVQTIMGKSRRSVNSNSQRRQCKILILAETF